MDQDMDDVEPYPPAQMVLNEQDRESEEEAERVILAADDYDAMTARLLPADEYEEIELGHFTWEISGYRTLDKKVYSPTFTIGGHPWQILLFPYGNQHSDHVSMYLETGYPKDREDDWSVCAQFAIVMFNPNSPTTLYEHSTAHHRFDKHDRDWGFLRYYPLRTLLTGTDGNRPLVEDEKVSITAYVRVVRDTTGVLWHTFMNYDSKKETGFVGLKNQGATCYMNSLLQSLYFTTFFRRAVYQIPTEQDRPDNSITLALQRLFYHLETAEDAAGTTELTRSFGWDTADAFTQHDVQELNRVLQDNLEGKMKGTSVDGILSDIFVGSMKSYIKCVNVDFESSRTEDFWDIQLNVKGMKDLAASFRDYVQVETMEGENKYFAEGYGLQDAKKGVSFLSFPPVLHLHLMRFEYDLQRDQMVKINDRHEFPLTIDLEEYLAPEADRSVTCIYHLHGVLVHAGDLNAGHYYALLKPTKDEKWFKFDDDRVTPAALKEVLEENYGADSSSIAPGPTGLLTMRQRLRRVSNAYMLVYLREDQISKILQPLKVEDTPTHIKDQLEQEKLAYEVRRKELEDAHLFMNIKVLTVKDFKKYQGFDLGSFDDRDPANPMTARLYKILKSTSYAEAADLIAKDIGVGPGMIRLWVMVNRQNKTIRPDQPLPVESTCTMDEVRERNIGAKEKELRLWAEIGEVTESDVSEVEWPTDPAISKNAKILIFLKYFDIEAQCILGMGHVYVNRLGKILDLIPQINAFMKWPPSTSIELFEEIKPNMIETIRVKQTFAQAEISDGDIICFQKKLPCVSEKACANTSEENMDSKIKETPRFYDHLLNRFMVYFRQHDSKSGEFELMLNKKMTYDEVVERVGQKLQVDPTHLRLSLPNPRSTEPKPFTRRVPNVTLGTMIQAPYYAQGITNIFIYEVLGMSLADMENCKVVKYNWVHDGLSKIEAVDALVPKNAVFGDLVQPLQRRFGISDEDAENLRFLEVHGHKIYKKIPFDYSVASLHEYTPVYAEIVPAEELQSGVEDRIVTAFHYTREPTRLFGIPFIFLIKPSERFAETMPRLAKRLGIKEMEAARYTFTVVNMTEFSRPTQLEAEDVLYDLIPPGSNDHQLGLDHVDRSAGLARNTGERAILIRR